MIFPIPKFITSFNSSPNLYETTTFSIAPFCDLALPTRKRASVQAKYISCCSLWP